MKKRTLPYLLFFIPFSSFCQESKLIDSLKLLLTSDISDSLVYTIQCKLVDIYASNNFDSALLYAEAALELSLGLDERGWEAWSYNKIATAYDYKGSLDTALYWYQKSIDEYSAMKDTARLSDVYLNIGVCLHYSTLYDSALANYLKAVELKNAINSEKNLEYAFNNIGMILRTQGAYDRAIGYYEQSLDIKKARNDRPGIITTLGNMATSYQALKKYDTAELQILEALAMSKEIDNKSLQAWCYVSLGQNHFFKEEFNDALKYHLMASEILETDGEIRDVMLNKMGLATSYLRLGMYEKAEANFMEAQKLAIQFSMVENLSTIYSGLSQLFELTGDFQKSLSYYKKHDSVSDQIFNESKASIIEELNQKYQAEVKEKEIVKLEIDQQKSENQRNIFFLVSISVILGASFLFVLLRAKSRSNKIITKSLNEKETLLREIHHRVKNNLQVISSLLSLQSRFIEDETAQAAVNEGQNRVKSMALIHQKLYQNENLLGVEIIDYIKNLTNTLKEAYGINSDRIAIDYDVEDLKIDVDTIIPIGLILNELISNSFKYAFPNDREGNLKITLKKSNEELELKVKDDGVGTTKNIEKSNSFGMRMIQSLAMKLEANVKFNFENGAEASLLISSFKLV